MSRFTWFDTWCYIPHCHTQQQSTFKHYKAYNYIHRYETYKHIKERCKMLLAQTRIMTFFSEHVYFTVCFFCFVFFLRRLLFCNICIPASKSASYRRPCSTLLPSSNIRRVSLKPPSTPPTWGVPSVTLPAEGHGSLAPPVCAALRLPCQCRCLS